MTVKLVVRNFLLFSGTKSSNPNEVFLLNYPVMGLNLSVLVYLYLTFWCYDIFLRALKVSLEVVEYPIFYPVISEYSFIPIPSSLCLIGLGGNEKWYFL